MELGIRGRTALVLGAGGGIGGGIARALAAEGVRVAVADLNREAADATVDSISAADGESAAFEVRLGDHAAETSLVGDVQARFGPVDILINNTGGPPPTPVAGVALDVWRDHFESMIASVFNLTDLVLPSMRERGWGRIVTSTSSGVIVPIPGLGISNALRSTLLGWSKTLASEIGPDGLTSNIVVPGRIASKRAIEIDTKRAAREGRTAQEVTAESVANIPARRYGTPQEYGDAVAFLSSERAGFINGSVLRIDGGMIASV